MCLTTLYCLVYSVQHVLLFHWPLRLYIAYIGQSTMRSRVCPPCQPGHSVVQLRRSYSWFFLSQFIETQRRPLSACTRILSHSMPCPLISWKTPFQTWSWTQAGKSVSCKTSRHCGLASWATRTDAVLGRINKFKSWWTQKTISTFVMISVFLNIYVFTEVHGFELLRP